MGKSLALDRIKLQAAALITDSGLAYIDPTAVTYGAVGDGTTDDRTALSDAVTAAADGVLYLQPNKTFRIASALTIPAGVRVKFSKSTKIKPDFGVTLTINGELDAGLDQIFDDNNGVGTDGTFGATGGWTAGTGWTIGSGVATHDGAHTATLAHTCAGVNGKTFIVKYTIGGTPGGGITASIGGVDGTKRTVAGTYVDYITATGTGVLTFTPESTFGGTLDNIEVYMLGTIILGAGSSEKCYAEWFGAVGDGITDDYSAIQKAIYSAAAICKIEFLNKTYVSSSSIKVIDDTSLVGDISVVTGGVSENEVILIDDADDVKIDGIKIVHNNSTTSSAAIRINNKSKNTVIKNCIIDSDAISILCRNSMRPIIQNNRIIHNGYNAISINYTTTTGSIDIGVSDVTMTVVSSGYFSIGDGVIIPGAGAAGVDLVTVIDNIVGTTWTLHDAASTTVTGVYVRHYESIDEDYAYAYAVIENNYINQDAARPGIEARSGGARIIGNTVIAPALNGGTAGITVGFCDNGIVDGNYVYGFTMGIEAGMLGAPGSVLVDTGTLENGTYGGVTISNNIVKSCDIGISTSNAANYSRTVTLSGNHIIITDDGSWSNHRGMDLYGKDVIILGGSVIYQTSLAYTDTNSRKYTGCRTNYNARYIKFVGTEFINLNVALNGGYVNTEEVFDNCSFDNCYYSVSQYSSAPVGNVVRFNNCQFHNVRTARVQRNIYITGCSFKNESDFVVYNKFPVQFRIDNDNFVVFRNNIYSGVTRGAFGVQSDYGSSSSSYMYPTISIDDDIITVKAGLTSNKIYNYIVTTFGTYLLPLLYNKPILVYSTNTKYMFTYNGKVKYASIASDPANDSWTIGDRVEETSPTTSGHIGLVCITSGTQGVLSGVTGSINSGSATLTVNSATNLEIGMYITIAGVSGVKRITNISETTVTVDSNSDATVNDAAVGYSTAVFKTYGTID